MYAFYNVCTLSVTDYLLVAGGLLGTYGTSLRHLIGPVRQIADGNCPPVDSVRGIRLSRGD